MPVFEAGGRFALIVFDESVVRAVRVDRASTYERPTFAEPGSVIRNVNRVTGQPTFCCFVPDVAEAPQGVVAHFNCYVVDPQVVTWRDVHTTTYIAQL